MNWELSVVESVISSKMCELDKKYAIHMYLYGWWDKDMVLNLVTKSNKEV